MRVFKKGETPDKRGGGIVLVYGMPGVGKTRFAINNAGVAEPLFYANFDRDASHLLVNYQGEKYYYDDFAAGDQASAKAALSRLSEMKNTAVAAGRGVFVIDNASAFWDLVKLAYLPTKSTGEPMPKEYGDANSYIRDFLLSMEKVGVWTILTAPARQVWFGAKTDSKSGVRFYEAEGWKHIEYHLLVSVWLFVNVREPGARALPQEDAMFEYKYQAQIIYSKKRAAVEGYVLDNPTLELVLKAVKEIEEVKADAPAK